MKKQTIKEYLMGLKKVFQHIGVSSIDLKIEKYGIEFEIDRDAYRYNQQGIKYLIRTLKNILKKDTMINEISIKGNGKYINNENYKYYLFIIKQQNYLGIVENNKCLEIVSYDKINLNRKFLKKLQLILKQNKLLYLKSDIQQIKFKHY